ncbi:AIR synthase family protein [Halalkalirubrum salinum]|uniref:AIR synthase family protein n=1 Tax=Halalkalirubrum salinum TaxID=2563889 RepID=UPI0010FBA6D1|nr:AIR synthase family protein [Halalkalirubrum salinum]
MIGKLDPAVLSRILSRTGAENPDVITGAAYGEDAAAIDLGEETLVVSSDPISLAAESAGTLGVHIAANDVAASGADPEFLTNVIFLPDDDQDMLDTLTTQLDAAAKSIDVAIVGGHTEYLSELSRPTLSLTCLGRTDQYVPTGGVSVGDRILLTKGAAIEGTAILASDFASTLRDRGVDEDVIDIATGFFAEISVLPESRISREHASAMHDPTEGGVRAGLVELAEASGVDLSIERDRVPIRPETETICAAMGVDPLAIFGSGALLIAVAPSEAEMVVSALADASIDAATIGHAIDSADGDREGTDAEGTDEPDGALVLDGERIADPGRDELYPLWEYT